jgi:hypothetical protein
MGGLGESISTKMADAGYKVVVTHSPGNKGATQWIADMKARGVPSPNLADAFLLSLAAGIYPKSNPHSRRNQNQPRSWLAA